MPAKTQPKTLFKVEFWEENREHEPVRTEYVYAPMREDWAQTRKGVIRAMLWRGQDQANKRDLVWLSHLMAREDILVVVKVDEKWAAKQKAKLDEERARRDEERELSALTKRHTCGNCGGELDDDYCQGCGWRRQSSWLDRALGKQGKAVAGGEL